MPETYDVIVVGGGPSGSVASAFLGKAGKKVLLLDKAKFPRDKTCGDAISGKSLAVLRELGLIGAVEALPHSKIYGVTFSSPEGYVVDIPFRKEENVGYCVRRLVYDNMLFQNAKKYATAIEEFTVSDVIQENGFVVGVKGAGKDGKEQEFRAKVVIGADGASSVVANKLGLDKVDDAHYCIAVRGYYKGVTGMTQNIELHFCDSIVPGYFWIFPMDNGLANVGVGVLNRDLKKRHLNLKEWMFNEIKTNPLFKERFKDAEPASEVKAWRLPFGSKRRKNNGNGFLLVGDAASLVDPFTGEGMGNGTTSGWLASKVINAAFEANDFSEKTLSSYEKMIHEELDREIASSYRMQRLGSFKPLLNWIIKKAYKNQHARDLIANTLANDTARNEFTSPFLYLKILFT
ncbi:MAG: NAD(P)/FAD-dependent oxidoreductase [Candidatus Micrarchaeota archaeon]